MIFYLREKICIFQIQYNNINYFINVFYNQNKHFKENIYLNLIMWVKYNTIILQMMNYSKVWIAWIWILSISTHIIYIQYYKLFHSPKITLLEVFYLWSNSFIFWWFLKYIVQFGIILNANCLDSDLFLPQLWNSFQFRDHEKKVFYYIIFMNLISNLWKNNIMFNNSRKQQYYKLIFQRYRNNKSFILFEFTYKKFEILRIFHQLKFKIKKFYCYY